MGMGLSLLLIAAGAIMRYAVTADAEGFDLQTIGVILMVVGAVGAVLSLIFWTSWGGFGRRDAVGVETGRTVVREREVR